MKKIKQFIDAFRANFGIESLMSVGSVDGIRFRWILFKEMLKK